MPSLAALHPQIVHKAAALSALEPLGAEFPQNERLKKRIDELRSGR